MSTLDPIRVYCLAPDQRGHIRPIEDAFGADAVFDYDGDCEDATQLLEGDYDLALCVNEWRYDVARCLEAAKAAGIPSLLLQDGILEWRCQYENPLFGYGRGPAQHQPVLSDKIACLGRQSARTLSAWGNPDKVEVTGMPRMDGMLGRTPPAPRRPGRRILVMTAKKAGFTDEQVACVLRSLRDIRKHIETRHPNCGIIWRVAPNLTAELGIENQLAEFSGLELAEVLEQADAVITTPSTAILESILFGRPVAALDYFNTPRFVQTAWTISAPEHIESVIQEILDPSAAKLQFQHECLHDVLSCGSPAAPRAAMLIRRITELTRDARRQGSPWRLPANLLGEAEAHIPATPLPLSLLYPGRAEFQDAEVSLLLGRLARSEARRAELESELKSRSVGNVIYRAAAKLSRPIRRQSSAVSGAPKPSRL